MKRARTKARKATHAEPLKGPSAQPRNVRLSAIETAKQHTQMRVGANPDTVQEYAAAVRKGDKFPPVVLVWCPVEGKHLIADGWHRVLAAEKAGRAYVSAVLRPLIPGHTAEQSAIRLGLRANTRHGLRPTRADARNRARRALLELPDLHLMPLRAIERETGVSHSTLARVRADLVRDCLLPHPITGVAVDEYTPKEYAAEQAFKSAFGDVSGTVSAAETFWKVHGYVLRLSADVDTQAWVYETQDYEEPRVVHRGLFAGRVVSFPVEGNGIDEKGRPLVYTPEDEWEPAAPQPPSEADRARWEEKRRQREAANAKSALVRGGLTPQHVDEISKLFEHPVMGPQWRALALAKGPEADDEAAINPDF